MGRNITDKYIFTGKISLQTALHIGSGAEGIGTDAACTRDSAGNILIPGTTIAGVFSAAIKSLLGNVFGHDNKPDCPCYICDLLGGSEGGAAKLIFDDAYLSNEAVAEVRDRVAMNRELQTARKHLKFDYETIPPGAQFNFSMTLELTNNDGDREDEFKKIITVGLEEFRAGRIVIGGHGTSGNGYCRLAMEDVYHLKLTDLDCLIPYLTGDISNIPKEYKQVYDLYKDRDLNFDPLPTSHTRLEIDLKLQLNDIDDLLVIKSSRLPIDELRDTVFVKTHNLSTGNNIHYIPGSSLKGPFRFRAEQILRTLGDDGSACDPTEDGGCGDCVVCGFFGYSKKAQSNGSAPKGRRGRISFMDAYPCAEIAEKHFDNVAIDRFTGGAKDSAKFDARLVNKGAFKTTIIMEDPELEEVSLLFQTLKDIYLKDLPIGYGTLKGHGWLRGVVTKMRWLSTSNEKMESIEDYFDVNADNGIKEDSSGLWRRLTIPGPLFQVQDTDDSIGALDISDIFKAYIEKLDNSWSDWRAGNFQVNYNQRSRW